jgi:acetoacetyl-CoA synthetase
MTASAEIAGSGPCTVVRPGYPSAPSLGVALDSWHVPGRSVRNEVGEPVVTAPTPSTPTGFRGDVDGSHYRSSYFDTDPGVWRHGDRVTLGDDYAMIVRGRSDATPNRGGVRMGSSDIYHAVETVSDVTASLVVGVKGLDGGDWIPSFVSLAPGAVVDDRPQSARRIDAVPHTLTGKKLRMPVKRIPLGERPADVVDLGAVDRPDALVEIADPAAARSPS